MNDEVQGVFIFLVTYKRRSRFAALIGMPSARALRTCPTPAGTEKTGHRRKITPGRTTP
jgi:hypothetical protein